MAASPWSRWSAKQYICAAMLGALVAMAVVAAISIILTPAHIFFSIADAKMTTFNYNETFYHYTHEHYNFTLVANNTSRRTAVWYSYLSAQIQYSSTKVWAEPEANVSTTSEWQLPRQATYVPFEAAYWRWRYDSNEVMSNATTEASMADVLVEAKVWFKFGVGVSRMYTVQATCHRVNFLNGTAIDFPVQCSS